ncbi:MAG: glycosyltransferase [Actinomycetes bacterium]
MVSSLILIATVITWLLTLHSILNQRFLISEPPEVVSDSIAILIPARNEELVIGGAVSAALGQGLLTNFRVYVLDDDSTDGTAHELTHISSANLTVISSKVEPPSGWLGKPFACHRLAQSADAKYLVFLDSDVTLGPSAIASAIKAMQKYDLKLVSPYPKQIANGLLNRFIQPLLQWSWLTTVPLCFARRSKRPSLAVANGQFLICDAAAYRSVGGHEAIKSEVFDDIELLRLFLRAGLAGTVIDGTELATCHMYRTNQELVSGYAKSLWQAFGGWMGSVATLGFLSFVYIFPLIGFSTGQIRLATFAYLGGVIGRAFCAQKTKSRILPDALGHPISVALFVWLNVVSWQRHLRGTITWKDRNINVS